MANEKQKIKFKKLSYSAYTLLGAQTDDNTIYFILDKPLIFVGKKQYGVTLDESKHLINSVQFNKDGQLCYTILGSSEIKIVPGLGVATETANGLMSADHVKELKRLTQLTESLEQDGITDLKKFVEDTVGEADTQWVDVTP